MVIATSSDQMGNMYDFCSPRRRQIRSRVCIIAGSLSTLAPDETPRETPRSVHLAE